jgi:hypothetical protein
MTDPTPETPFTVRDRIIWLSDGIQIAIDDLLTITQGTTNAVVVTNERLTDIQERLDRIQSVLGAEPYSSTETANVRALLINILSALGSYGLAPDGGQGSSSVGTVTVNGYRYVRWGVIDGLTTSTDGRELTPNDSWSDWEVYIKSDAAESTMHDATDSELTITIATNSWTALGGNHTLLWSVPSNYDVKGYIRGPEIVDPLTFDLVPNSTYQPYNYGTGPWPTSTMWEQPETYDNPFIGPTMTVYTRFKLVPFDNSGATVVQTVRSPGGVGTYSVSETIYIDADVNVSLAVTGGNGSISFHVTVNPDDWPA